GYGGKIIAKDLRDRIKKDGKGRPYVDAFLLSHPDEDHCRGLERHFHLGPIADYPDDAKEYKDKKIVIREMWSSPIVFRRASKSHTLCRDAEAFDKEARRRVALNLEKKFVVDDGDRIQVMGEDVDGKTDDLEPICRKVNTTFNTICGRSSSYFSAYLLGPIEAQDEEDKEELLAKNQSSIIINFTLAADSKTPDGAKFLSGGDAEVYIWREQWSRHKHEVAVLQYDLLQAPHHCSWHSLSEDSWSEKKRKAKVDADARSALSQVRSGGFIVASSKPIKDDDKDPPCIRAKEEYEDILKGVGGTFYCTAEYPKEASVEPLEFTVGKNGLTPPAKTDSGAKAASVITAARTPMPHG
ncbi:metallohydrolase, partial [Aquabacterium soli]